MESVKVVNHILGRVSQECHRHCEYLWAGRSTGALWISYSNITGWPRNLWLTVWIENMADNTEQKNKLKIHGIGGAALLRRQCGVPDGWYAALERGGAPGSVSSNDLYMLIDYVKSFVIAILFPMHCSVSYLSCPFANKIRQPSTRNETPSTHASIGIMVSIARESTQAMKNSQGHTRLCSRDIGSYLPIPTISSEAPARFAGTNTKLRYFLRHWQDSCCWR